jgi:hypothetical protein
MACAGSHGHAERPGTAVVQRKRRRAPIIWRRLGASRRKPDVKVAWQVTGTRRDRYAEAQCIEVEQEKSETERGQYLHPELYDVGPETADVGRPVGYMMSLIGKAGSDSDSDR